MEINWKRDIRAIRKAHGLTQPAFAQRLGVSTMTVKFWETGRTVPSDGCAERLRRFASVPVVAKPKSVARPKRAEPELKSRKVIHIKQAIALMGLKDEGRHNRSDRTIRNALKNGTLPGWRSGNGAYRDGIAEWCFYQDDFDRWLATHYVAYRDPRRPGIRSS